MLGIPGGEVLTADLPPIEGPRRRAPGVGLHLRLQLRPTAPEGPILSGEQGLFAEVFKWLTRYKTPRPALLVRPPPLSTYEAHQAATLPNAA